MQMKRSARRRKTAAIVLMGVVGLGLTGCFPDTSSTPPSDPFVNELYNRMNYDPRDRRPRGLTWSPKLREQRRLVGPPDEQRRTRCTTRTSTQLLYSSDYTVYYTLGENILVGPGSMSPASIEGAWRASAPALGQHHQPIVQRRWRRDLSEARRRNSGPSRSSVAFDPHRFLKAKRPQPGLRPLRSRASVQRRSVVTQTRRVTYVDFTGVGERAEVPHHRQHRQLRWMIMGAR